MIRCPKCGFEIVQIEAKFCPHCGEEINQTITCPDCHYSGIPSNARFCPKCGHSFAKKQVDPIHRFDNQPISVCGESTFVNGKEAVDLGLSALWSVHNIGANDITYDGLNFSWGDPLRKTVTSKFANWFTGAPTQSDICGSKYDMARFAWGGQWKLPTCQECIELIENCSWKVVRYQGDNFYKVTSYSNGNYILMPTSIKLWVGDRAFGGTVHYFDTRAPQLESELFDVDHTYFVRSVIAK